MALSRQSLVMDIQVPAGSIFGQLAPEVLFHLCCDTASEEIFARLTLRVHFPLLYSKELCNVGALDDLDTRAGRVDNHMNEKHGRQHNLCGQEGKKRPTNNYNWVSNARTAPFCPRIFLLIVTVTITALATKTSSRRRYYVGLGYSLVGQR